MAHLVDCLPSMNEAIGLTLDPAYQEALRHMVAQEDQKFKVIFRRELKASLGYTRTHLPLQQKQLKIK